MSEFVVVEFASAVEQPRVLMPVHNHLAASELVEQWISRALVEHEPFLNDFGRLRKLLCSRLSRQEFKLSMGDLIREMDTAKTDSAHWFMAAQIWCHMTGHVIVVHELSL